MTFLNITALLNLVSTKMSCYLCVSGAGMAVVGDTIYVCGGYDGTHHLASVESYDVRVGQWSSVANMSIPRCYVGACVLKGQLFVVAG